MEKVMLGVVYTAPAFGANPGLGETVHAVVLATSAQAIRWRATRSSGKAGHSGRMVQNCRFRHAQVTPRIAAIGMRVEINLRKFP